jgi:hypothetical protein
LVSTIFYIERGDTKIQIKPRINKILHPITATTIAPMILNCIVGRNLRQTITPITVQTPVNMPLTIFSKFSRVDVYIPTKIIAIKKAKNGVNLGISIHLLFDKLLCKICNAIIQLKTMYLIFSWEFVSLRDKLLCNLFLRHSPKPIYQEAN